MSIRRLVTCMLVNGTLDVLTDRAILDLKMLGDIRSQ